MDIPDTTRRGFISYSLAATAATAAGVLGASIADESLNRECLDAELPPDGRDPKRVAEREQLAQELASESALSATVCSPLVAVPFDVGLSLGMQDPGGRPEKMLIAAILVITSGVTGAFGMPYFRNRSKMEHIIAKTPPKQQGQVRDRLQMQQLFYGAYSMIPVFLTSLLASSIPAVRNMQIPKPAIKTTTIDEKSQLASEPKPDHRRFHQIRPSLQKRSLIQR